MKIESASLTLGLSAGGLDLVVVGFCLVVVVGGCYAHLLLGGCLFCWVLCSGLVLGCVLVVQVVTTVAVHMFCLKAYYWFW
jgi:hypothetical protein